MKLKRKNGYINTETRTFHLTEPLNTPSVEPKIAPGEVLEEKVDDSTPRVNIKDYRPSFM